MADKTADQFFTTEQGEQIVEAVRAAESHSSGEIRVHLEDRCGDAAWHRARELFYELDMDDTRQQNGLILYLAVLDKQFAIYADEGYDDYLSDGFWDELIAHLSKRFQEGEFLLGLIEILAEIGTVLRAWFPAQGDNPNELSDELSIG